MVYPACRAYASQICEFVGWRASAAPLRTRIAEPKMREVAGSLYKEAVCLRS
jgi:hypothetical protein